MVGGSAAEARRMIRDLEFDICNAGCRPLEDRVLWGP